jgi:hypothetical protein
MQFFLRFGMIQIERDAIDGAHFFALRRIKMADAFGAFCWIDFVDFDAHVDGLVRALGLAHVAVNALIGDFECHDVLCFSAYFPTEFPTLPLSAAPTVGCTKSFTSPPKIAISRTMVAEINMYLSDGVRNIVSTPGFNFRFMPAI